jgi:4-alpha-glucanotransferase
VLKAWLSFLAGSQARIMVVNLEDLWLETRSQNVPGTGAELPNWTRRAVHDLEEIESMPEVIEVLRAIDRLRRAGPRKMPREALS